MYHNVCVSFIYTFCHISNIAGTITSTITTTTITTTATTTATTYLSRRASVFPSVHRGNPSKVKEGQGREGGRKREREEGVLRYTTTTIIKKLMERKKGSEIRKEGRKEVEEERE
jgi:hypothetical protein